MVSASAPVDLTFLDLPLLGGEESPHSPHIAVAARPWTGPVAVYSANQDYGYRFRSNVRRPATIGTLLEPLPAGTPGQWMNRDLRVGITAGVLQSRERSEVLNGANVAALRYGTTGDWEVIQFQGAELIAPREYRLRGLLRGQAGTDGIAPPQWPAGTSFVLLDGAVGQLNLPASARGLERHYRVGPASRGTIIQVISTELEAFSGVGLRPYRPVHLAAERLPGGAIALSWTRRTRIDGDSWAGTDVPLGEEREAYVVRVNNGAMILREIASDAPTVALHGAGADFGRCRNPSLLRRCSGLGPLRHQDRSKGSNSMARTAQLSLPLVMPSQAQKHVTVNEALARLDAAAQLRVHSSRSRCPPASGHRRHELSDPAARDRTLGRQGRTGCRLVQRRMGVSCPDGRLAGLG